MQSKFLVSILGPTAIGKTSVGISLAKYFKTEIVSSDSRQFYKEMRIGTAVPNQTELNEVKHHFIQHISIREPYSVGQYERDAMARLKELFHKYDVVVLVGGSGLFHKALVEGLDDFPDIDPAIRKDLIKQLNNVGLAALQDQLKKIDPVSYKCIDINNPQRLIRAIEVSKGTGIPFSSYKSKTKKARPFRQINIGLMAERELIYSRINQRVDKMIEEGLVEEARNLITYKDLNALNTVGYKELFKYFEESISLPEAIEEIKMNTRRFAKRQLTWFRKDQSIRWFNNPYSLEEITAYIEGIIKK